MIKNRFHSSIKRKADITTETEELKTCNENIFSLNHSQSTNDSTKSLTNLSPVQTMTDQEYLELRDAEYYSKPLSSDSDLFSMNGNFSDLIYYDTKQCGEDKQNDSIEFKWDFETCFV